MKWRRGVYKERSYAERYRRHMVLQNPPKRAIHEPHSGLGRRPLSDKRYAIRAELERLHAQREQMAEFEDLSTPTTVGTTIGGSKILPNTLNGVFRMHSSVCH